MRLNSKTADFRKDQANLQKDLIKRVNVDPVLEKDALRGLSELLQLVWKESKIPTSPAKDKEPQRQAKGKTKLVEKQKPVTAHINGNQSYSQSKFLEPSQPTKENLQSLKPGEGVAGNVDALVLSTRVPATDLKAQSPSECGGLDSMSRTLSGQHQAEVKERQCAFEKCAMHVAIAYYTDYSKRKQAELVTPFISYRGLKKLLNRI
eukprot:TRINITY_DN7817_c0_g2_i7.p1 TRINITY_DN7817_c0_g2~~TRINITY_DN7817_c0_g2_i7.p1  ORF type:complete len:206 (-),score=11.93 TRINITY_DN7817_c0_g2_i7:184-801(-)